MDSPLNGWWDNQESTSSTFWFQPVWGLPACEQHEVNVFHVVGVSVSATKDMAHIIIYNAWGGTKGPWVCFNGWTIINLSCLTVFLYFCIFSLVWLNLLFGIQEDLGGLVHRQESGRGHCGVGGSILFWEDPIGSCLVQYQTSLE